MSQNRHFRWRKIATHYPVVCVKSVTGLNVVLSLIRPTFAIRSAILPTDGIPADAALA
jgi:hypothetical protein